MNSVNLIGRIVRDPNYGEYSDDKHRTSFSLAINRGKGRNGEDLGADYPGVVCFGKLAETVSKYCHKGMLVGVEGRLITSSYEKDGCKIYSTIVMAEKIQFLEKKKDFIESEEIEF